MGNFSVEQEIPANEEKEKELRRELNRMELI